KSIMVRQASLAMMALHRPLASTLQPPMPMIWFHIISLPACMGRRWQRGRTRSSALSIHVHLAIKRIGAYIQAVMRLALLLFLAETLFRRACWRIAMYSMRFAIARHPIGSTHLKTGISTARRLRQVIVLR